MNTIYYIDIKRTTLESFDSNSVILDAANSDPTTVMRIKTEDPDQALLIFEKYKAASAAIDADAGCEIQYVELIEESDEDDGFSYETVIESKYPEQIVERVAP